MKKIILKLNFHFYLISKLFFSIILGSVSVFAIFIGDVMVWYAFLIYTILIAKDYFNHSLTQPLPACKLGTHENPTYLHIQTPIKSCL